MSCQNDQEQVHCCSAVMCWEYRVKQEEYKDIVMQIADIVLERTESVGAC